MLLLTSPLKSNTLMHKHAQLQVHLQQSRACLPSYHHHNCHPPSYDQTQLQPWLISRRQSMRPFSSHRSFECANSRNYFTGRHSGAHHRAPLRQHAVPSIAPSGMPAIASSCVQPKQITLHTTSPSEDPFDSPSFAPAKNPYGTNGGVLLSALSCSTGYQRISAAQTPIGQYCSVLAETWRKASILISV